MSNNDKNKKCENCKHFATFSSRTYCIKYAPRGVDGGSTPWPGVQKIHRCSEFEKKPSEKKGSVCEF